MLTASSSREIRLSPARGRLDLIDDDNGFGGWSSANNDTNPWFQVSFGHHVTLTGVITQGRYNVLNYVETYELQWSLDGVTWTDYQEDDNTKVFDGNFDSETHVTHALAIYVKAIAVRIRVIDYHMRVGLRLELKGCEDFTSVSVSVSSPTTPTRTTSVTPPTTTRSSTPVITTVTGHPPTTSYTGTWASTPTTTEVVECIDWSDWVNSGGVTPEGDVADIETLKNETGCHDPVAIECRSISSQVPYDQTGQVLKCNTWDGLLCNSTDNDGYCYDYEVRLGCLKDVPECRPSTTTAGVTTTTPELEMCENITDSTQCPPEGCLDGKVCNGTDCVYTQDCPCVINGEVIGPNKWFMGDNCAPCRCFDGQVMCQPPPPCPTCPPGYVTVQPSLPTNCSCCEECESGVICNGTDECLPEEEVCNGILDCPGGEDEEHCTTVSLPWNRTSTITTTPPFETTTVVTISTGSPPYTTTTVVSSTTPPQEETTTTPGVSTPTPSVSTTPRVTTTGSTSTPSVSTTPGVTTTGSTPTPGVSTTPRVTTTGSTPTPGVSTTPGVTTTGTTPTPGISSTTPGVTTGSTTTPPQEETTTTPGGSTPTPGVSTTPGVTTTGSTSTPSVSTTPGVTTTGSTPTPSVSTTPGVTTTGTTPTPGVSTTPGLTTTGSTPTPGVSTTPGITITTGPSSTPIVTTTTSPPVITTTTPGGVTTSPVITTPTSTPWPTTSGPCVNITCAPPPSLKPGEDWVEVDWDGCCFDYIVICVPKNCPNDTVIRCEYPEYLTQVNPGECCPIFECLCPEECPDERPDCPPGQNPGEHPVACGCFIYTPCSGTCRPCEAKSMFVNITDTIGFFNINDTVRGLCDNRAPVEGVKHCSGYCDSNVSYQSVMMGYDYSQCSCCQPITQDVQVALTCTNGDNISRAFPFAQSCSCRPCGFAGI